jgi:hypothetical protein
MSIQPAHVSLGGDIAVCCYLDTGSVAGCRCIPCGGVAYLKKAMHDRRLLD